MTSDRRTTMLARWRNIPLFIALIASLLLHVTVIVPGFIGLASLTDPPRPLLASFEPDAVQAPQRQQPHEVTLGIDRSTASTVTWIGYEEYQEHLAALAEVEQAAFAEQAAATSLKQAANQPAPATPAGAEHPDAAAESSTPGSDAMPPPDEAVTSLSAWLDLANLAPNIERGRRPIVRERPMPRSDAVDAEAAMRALMEALAAASPRIEEDVVPADSQPAPAASPASPASPSAEQQPSVQADKESTPSSVIDTPRDHWQMGKPLAAHGLELKPRRPQFDVLTTVTAWPRNPLVQIRFDRAGVPKDALIVEPSGDKRVDIAIKASLYRWRAEGEPLRKLRGDETLAIQLRLLLTSRE